MLHKILRTLSPLERTGRGSGEHTDRGRQAAQIAGMGTSGPAPNGATGVSTLDVGAPARHERGLEVPSMRRLSEDAGNVHETGVSHFNSHGATSQLLFFDTFSHDVIEELNLDLVQVIRQILKVVGEINITQFNLIRVTN